MNALYQRKVIAMARAYQPKARLDSLEYSSEMNPFIGDADIKTRNKLVRTGRVEQLVNAKTGETDFISVIQQREVVDKDNFVKIFAAGVAAMFDLSRTAQKVFMILLKKYERSPMVGGYSDFVDLYWQDDKLNGEKPTVSQQTFNLGLRELIDKKFLYPRLPYSFWINPNLIFKGDRVMFVKEYIRQYNPSQARYTQGRYKLDRDPNTVDFIHGKTDEELQLQGVEYSATGNI